MGRIPAGSPHLSDYFQTFLQLTAAGEFLGIPLSRVPSSEVAPSYSTLFHHSRSTGQSSLPHAVDGVPSPSAFNSNGSYNDAVIYKPSAPVCLSKDHHLQQMPFYQESDYTMFNEAPFCALGCYGCYALLEAPPANPHLHCCVVSFMPTPGWSD